MGYVRVRKDKNFTMMSNKHLKDGRLSWKAKGILSYLLSLPDDWRIYKSEIKKHSTDGKTSTNTGFKELVDLGYVTEELSRDEKGHFNGKDYTVYENPTDIGKPDCRKPDIGESDIGKPATTNNLLNKELKVPKTNNIQEEENWKWTAIKNIWNDLADKEKDIKAIRSVTERRKEHLKARINTVNDLEELKLAVKEISHSDFLTGSNNRNWAITFDWLIKNDSNWNKVLEQQYRDREDEEEWNEEDINKVDQMHFG